MLDLSCWNWLCEAVRFLDRSKGLLPNPALLRVISKEMSLLSVTTRTRTETTWRTFWLQNLALYRSQLAQRSSPAYHCHVSRHSRDSSTNTLHPIVSSPRRICLIPKFFKLKFPTNSWWCCRCGLLYFHHEGHDIALYSYNEVTAPIPDTDIGSQQMSITLNLMKLDMWNVKLLSVKMSFRGQKVKMTINGWTRMWSNMRSSSL